MRRFVFGYLFAVFGSLAAPFFLLVGAGADFVSAQEIAAYADETDARVPRSRGEQQAERERLFEELATEVAELERISRLVRRVARLVKPSVVHIEASKTQSQRGRTESYDEAGSGVIVRLADRDWVLTNRHVIAGASPEEISLRLHDGRELHPTRILHDPSTDVAVLQIQSSDVLPAKIGDSDDVEIGDFVLAIGSPFGLSHSVTFGIVSAKGRRDLTLGEEKIDLQDFFQTDAAINPGNSGGPLLNLRGELIGLNTAIASSSGGSEGIGFAIPINMAVLIADQLARFGEVRRAYLGVTLDPNFRPVDAITSGVSYPGGARVKEVRSGSPADAAQLRRGDIILQFGSIRVDDDDHLVARVGLTPVGTEVPVIIFREGQKYRTTVKVSALPK